MAVVCRITSTVGGAEHVEWTVERVQTPDSARKYGRRHWAHPDALAWPENYRGVSVSGGVIDDGAGGIEVVEGARYRVLGPRHEVAVTLPQLGRVLGPLVDAGRGRVDAEVLRDLLRKYG